MIKKKYGDFNHKLNKDTEVKKTHNSRKHIEIKTQKRFASVTDDDVTVLNICLSYIAIKPELWLVHLTAYFKAII